MHFVIFDRKYEAPKSCQNPKQSIRIKNGSKCIWFLNDNLFNLTTPQLNVYFLEFGQTHYLILYILSKSTDYLSYTIYYTK